MPKIDVNSLCGVRLLPPATPPVGSVRDCTPRLTPHVTISGESRGKSGRPLLALELGKERLVLPGQLPLHLVYPAAQAILFNGEISFRMIATHRGPVRVVRHNYERVGKPIGPSLYIVSLASAWVNHPVNLAVIGYPVRIVIA